MNYLLGLIDSGTTNPAGFGYGASDVRVYPPKGQKPFRRTRQNAKLLVGNRALSADEIKRLYNMGR